MANYRYNSPNYGRRTTCARTPASETCAKPVCCDDKAEYDELGGMPLAMAYVPWQEWKAVYEAEKGFHRGTIFAELDKPFCGLGGCGR